MRLVFACFLLPCFNEAAVYQLRKFRGGKPIPVVLERFNEAAVYQLRKCGYSILLLVLHTRASMRPQSINCGNPQSRQAMRGIISSFNEAAVYQLRKFLLRALEGLRTLPASMRPQSINCGNLFVGEVMTGSGVDASMRPQSINCGNGIELVLPVGQRPASMRPQSINCGNSGSRSRSRRTL